MGGHYSHSPVLTRGVWTLLAVLGAGACVQDALIGETGEGASTNGGRGNGGLDWGDDCYQRSELAALPASERTFPESPSAWVGKSRGKWTSTAGDTLEVTIDAPATRVEFTCYEPGTQPSVSFMLAGRVSIRTVDGAWDETFDASFGLSELRSGASAYVVLSARGELDLTTLHGSFKLPSNLERAPQELIQFSLEYQDDSWIVHRTVEVDRTKPSAICHCPGDAAPAWAPPQQTFRRADASKDAR